MERLYNAYLDDFNKITILLPKHYFNGKSRNFTLIHEHEEIDLFIKETYDIGSEIKYICLLPTFVEVGILYFVKDEYGNQTELQSGAIVRSPRFDTLYYYDKEDLGVNYSKNETTFKLWAPTATTVSLILVHQTRQVHPMKQKAPGVYEVTILGDLDGYLYRYSVTNNNRENEIIDVYGIASNANHEYSAVVSKEKLEHVRKLHEKFTAPTDAIIYELSIRDFTMDKNSGVSNRGKFLGLIEPDTTTDTGKPTGLNYLKQLGVTHVQVMPIFDFAGVDEIEVEHNYNWGYNPEQFNTPDGSFASDANEVYTRINELRKVINTLHDHHIGIIMDVVYNHVFDFLTFPFEFMVPGYFYRYDHNGMPTNGSGCGNDLATEREMVRKFIVDSVKHWAKEYKIDGFRFDLMGLVDVDTMNIIRKVLDEINPDIIIYGEGWNMPTALPDSLKSTEENAYKLPGIAFFNGKYRDLIKGHTFDIKNIGYGFGNFDHLEDVKQLIAGSVGYEKQMQYQFFEPYQSINYLECHDNMTMYDKIKQALNGESKEIRTKRQRFATSVLLLSQGIPFIHSGQEFYRTKYGIDNSFNSPDKINLINWKRMEEHFEDVLYIRELIKLRKSHGAFRLGSGAKIKRHLSFIDGKEPGIIICELSDVGAYGQLENIRIIFNSTLEDFVYHVEDEYQLLFDGKTYLHGKSLTNYLIVPQLEVLIIGK